MLLGLEAECKHCVRKQLYIEHMFSPSLLQLTATYDYGNMTRVTKIGDYMSSSLVLSKSKFKPQALEYLRMVERTNKSIIITNFGQPTIKIMPYTPDADQTLSQLKGSVLSYKDPLEPVGLEDWENLP